MAGQGYEQIGTSDDGPNALQWIKSKKHVVGSLLIVLMLGAIALQIGSSKPEATNSLVTTSENDGNSHVQNAAVIVADVDVTGDSKAEKIKTNAKADLDISVHISHKDVCVGWVDQNGPPPCLRAQLEDLRKALQDENCGPALIADDAAEAVNEKLTKISSDTPFVFFRGSVAMFFQNLHCTRPRFYMDDTKIPHVISSGDAHPENFGTLMLANRKLIWGVNDFDHGFRSPFVLDVARGATGFASFCVTQAWQKCDEVAAAWVDGYYSIFKKQACLKLTNGDRLIEFAPSLNKIRGGYLVRSVFEKARETSDDKTALLAWNEKFVDIAKAKFKRGENILPISDRELPEFREAIQGYLYNGVPALAFFMQEDFFKVLDVAEKLGSGTGSIGLQRYYILLQGSTSEYEFDRVILEMKEVKNSILEKYEEYDTPALLEGERACTAGRLAYPYANVFHGWVNFRNGTYIIRRKSPWKAHVNLEKLDFNQFSDLAYVSGLAQAHYHTLLGCKNAECAFSEKASVDLEACVAISKFFESDPNLIDEFTNYAVKEVDREKEQFDLLVKTLESDSKLQKNPILFLNTPPKVEKP
mmetsp:Transcript_4245/g.7774  ORF Transcript_4245/g.7774 Transcript_4245/m.7774 type:complete len:586 (+) Transcript_4245:85-1842(+)